MVKELLKIILPFCRKINLSKFSNKRVGIDGHCWMHILSRNLTTELLCEPEPDFTLVFQNIIRILEIFRKIYKITPIFVLDGIDPPVKHEEKKKRFEKREFLKKKVEKLKSKHKFSKAIKLMKNVISFKPSTIRLLIEMLKVKNFEYIVSPYEGDFELIYLEKINKIDFIITNDSDLIPLGGKNILYNFNFRNFNGVFYNNNILLEIFPFVNCDNSFDFNKFLTLCIFKGGAYFDKELGGYYSLVKEIQTNKNYKEIIKNLIKNEKLEENIIKNFEMAWIAYKYNIVYDPIEKKCLHLHNLIEDDTDFLKKYKLNEINGDLLNNDLAYKISVGEVNPIYHNKMEPLNKDYILDVINCIYFDDINEYSNYIEKNDSENYYYIFYKNYFKNIKTKNFNNEKNNNNIINNNDSKKDVNDNNNNNLNKENKKKKEKFNKFDNCKIKNINNININVYIKYYNHNNRRNKYYYYQTNKYNNNYTKFKNEYNHYFQYKYFY